MQAGSSVYGRQPVSPDAAKFRDDFREAMRREVRRAMIQQTQGASSSNAEGRFGTAFNSPEFQAWRERYQQQQTAECETMSRISAARLLCFGGQSVITSSPDCYLKSSQRPGYMQPSSQPEGRGEHNSGGRSPWLGSLQPCSFRGCAEQLLSEPKEKPSTEKRPDTQNW